MRESQQSRVASGVAFLSATLLCVPIGYSFFYISALAIHHRFPDAGMALLGGICFGLLGVPLGWIFVFRTSRSLFSKKD